MNSLVELATQMGLKERPISLRQVASKFHVTSLKDANAAFEISEFYRRTGRVFGPLGAPLGNITSSPDGNYQQDFQLGSIKIQGNDPLATPSGVRKVLAKVRLAAVKCIGTEDPGGSDETYAIVSVINLDPNLAGQGDKLVTTERTEIINDVHAGDTILKSRAITKESGVGFPGSGIKIHVALFDHESGDADDIKARVQAFLEDASKKAVDALASAEAADGAELAGPIGDFMDFEVGGVKPFKIITLGLADMISRLLSDDLIGEHEFVVPASVFTEWSVPSPDDPNKLPAWEASFRKIPGFLENDVQFNWPQRTEDEFLFGLGGGSYKVYLEITPQIILDPIVPRLP